MARASYDVSSIQLSLGVATDDLVLPKREPLGVGLIQSGNMNIQRSGVKHVDVAKIARIERQLDFRTGPFGAAAPKSSPLYFSPLIDAVWKTTRRAIPSTTSSSLALGGSGDGRVFLCATDEPAYR